MKILDNSWFLALYIVIIYIFFSCTESKQDPVNTSSAQWANFERYESKNSQILSDTNDTTRIVFMGNSITEGWSHKDLTFFKNPSYINRGIGGQTTPQMLLRFRADVIDLAPKAVVLLAGINDIAQNTGPISLSQTLDNIKSMAELADINGITPIICATLPASHFPWRPEINPSEKVIRLNRMLKSYCMEKNFTYVDYYKEMVNNKKGLKAEYTYDEVHCTIAGYKKMEEIIGPVLSAL